MAKKMIISRSQFKKLNEGGNDANIVIPFNGNTPQEANAAYQGARSQIDYAKSHSSNGDVTVSLEGDGYDENKGMQTATVEPNNPNITTQLDPSLFSANPGVQVKDKEIYEGKKFTKKQLEEARLTNIRKNGIVRTKKNLFEGLSEFGFNGYNLLNMQEKEELADFCRNNDFFIYGNAGRMFGWKHTLINTREDWRQEVISEIFSAQYVMITHEKDREIMRDLGNKINFYEGVDIVKLSGLPKNEDYYIIWEH